MLLEKQPPQAVSTIAGSPPARSAREKRLLASRGRLSAWAARAARSSTDGSEEAPPCPEDGGEDRLRRRRSGRSCDRAARARAPPRPRARAPRSARAAPALRGTFRASAASCASTTAAAGSVAAPRAVASCSASSARLPCAIGGRRRAREICRTCRRLWPPDGRAGCSEGRRARTSHGEHALRSREATLHEFRADYRPRRDAWSAPIRGRSSRVRAG